jgi:general stress protein 26
MTREEFAAFVRAAELGVVATAAADGSPEAALVSLAATDAGEVIFDCATTARKLANLAVNPRVALVIGWNEGVSLQVEGVADVLGGADRQRYGRLYAEQFPGSRALDEHFAIVRVTPRWLRYYDARPESYRVVEGALDDGVAEGSSVVEGS